MKVRKGIWNKKVVGLLCVIMIATFITGCTDEYYYQMDNEEYETEYNEWGETDDSHNDASGAADYEEVADDEMNTNDEESISKGNSGNTTVDIDYTFRNDNLLESHYEKHGVEMGFASPEEYEAAANRMIKDEEVLHKIEAEDGDDVYYLERTNEFVVVSTDGYIRTYFYPNDGIDYFNRQ